VECGIESVLQNVMKTFLTFLINKCQYKTSYLIFAAEIKINIKNTTAFFNAMQTSCIKNRCMMDVLKVIFFVRGVGLLAALVSQSTILTK
jgi:hypothetical protein